jgi:uncharacterized protein YbjT (DUF2867 family)
MPKYSSLTEWRLSAHLMFPTIRKTISLKQALLPVIKKFIKLRDSHNHLNCPFLKGETMEDKSAGTMVITGAFSYTGKYATRILLDRGYRIRTLTHHPDRDNPFGGKVQAFPMDFEHQDRLCNVLQGSSVLINTYWVRFPRGHSTFETAVHNTRVLIQAAKDAGIERIVHVSIANPSLQSPLGYYKGKAQLEQDIKNSGLSYTILRPTVIFGAEDILINNIAWFIRNYPVFGIPGDGRYAIRPIYVEDMALLIADAVDRQENVTLDAVGPESYTFEDLAKLIAAQIGRSVHLMRLPTALAYLFTYLIGKAVGDTILTWEEYKGLMGNLLASQAPAAGATRLSQWLEENRDRVGMRYASEVARHY